MKTKILSEEKIINTLKEMLFDTPPGFSHGDSWFAEHCGLAVAIPTYTFSPSVNSRVSHGTDLF